MKTVVIALALLIMLPSLSAARGGGGHGGMGPGGLVGFPVVVYGGVHGFGHPGVFRGAHVSEGRVNHAHDGAAVGHSPRNFGLVSPPLIIERRGNGFERIVQPNQAFTGPLIIERQGDTFVRVH
ncbi:MAG TPA: hypothetical protein VKF36_04200 [Syntrophorhabdales bacterium]|nr:hypothetical protein [Syntrophorhabdales bacterium]